MQKKPEKADFDCRPKPVGQIAPTGASGRQVSLSSRILAGQGIEKK
jgi:hypothetical protein